MDNHVHLLIKETEEEVGSFMKRIGVRYVSWYNRKYNRCGHLFQDRFKSEVVETDEYLLTVLRYIHQNPLAAGMIKNLDAGVNSSYIEYIGRYKIIDGDFILKLFSENREIALESFKNFMKETVNGAGCLELYDKVILTDEEVKEFIQKYAKVKTPTALQAMEKETRDGYIRRIKEIEGVTTRQIARLTGISQSVISRA